MSKNVGTGKTINISVRTSGIDNGEEATFDIFKKDGDEKLDTITGKVSEGYARCDWTAKGPEEDDDDQFWEVYYKVKCKGLETSAGGLKVFTDWVEVTSVDEADASLPDAAFRVTAQGETRDRTTGSSGVRKEEHLPGPGPITVEWLPPFELVEWVDEDGPKRKAKVRKVETAHLVFPPQGTHTQYVNLEADEELPEQGHTLKVKVTLLGAKAGAKGYAKLRFGEDNSKRNDPKPELADASAQDWCGEGEVGLEFELAGDDGTADCEAILEFELGLAGCDTFTLKVGGSKECSDEQLVIRNSRKIYYQRTQAISSDVPGFDMAEAALAKVGIEYEEYHVVDVGEDEPPAGAFIDGAAVGTAGQALVVGDHNFDWFKGKFQDDKAPLGAHVIVCDAQYDGGSPAHEQTLEAEAEFSKKTFTITDPHLYDVFPTAIQDGESSVLSGSTWESTAPSGHPDNGKSGEITADDCVFGVARTPDRVQVVLPEEAAAIVGDGDKASTDASVKHPVKITLKLHVARGPFLGESNAVHQLIVRVPNEGRFNEILVHELGHSIGETLTEAPPGLSASDHGRAYEGKEHQGHHCGYGLSDDEFASDDLSMSTSGKCAMFGTGDADADPQSRGEFCELCEPFVRATDCLGLEGAKGKQNYARAVDETAIDDSDAQGPPATATLQIYQEGLGDEKVLMGAFQLDVEGGASLSDTPEGLGIGWKSTEPVKEFGAAIVTKGAKVTVKEFARNKSEGHLLRSRNGRGKYSSVKNSVHRGGYMFAPASTDDGDLLPDFLWKGQKPVREKVMGVHVQFEGERDRREVWVLHPTDVTGDAPYEEVELTLSAKLVLTAEAQTQQTDADQDVDPAETAEHELAPGPKYTFSKHEFLDDASKSKSALKTQLIKEYGNPAQSNPVHARDWVSTAQSTATAAVAFRAAIKSAVAFINSKLPADKHFTLNEWEVAVTFLTEGGISNLGDAIKYGTDDPTYDGYGSLGIDSYVTRWKKNSNQIKSYTSDALTKMAKDDTNVVWNTNEAGDSLQTFSSLETEDAAHAVAGLVAEAKWAFAENLQDAGVVGPWTTKCSDLPLHVQFFWTTLYYNTGTGNGKKSLRNQGCKYHDNVWRLPDEHWEYSGYEKYNANWRTATFRLFKKEITAW